MVHRERPRRLDGGLFEREAVRAWSLVRIDWLLVPYHGSNVFLGMEGFAVVDPSSRTEQPVSWTEEVQQEAVLRLLTH